MRRVLFFNFFVFRLETCKVSVPCTVINDGHGMSPEPPPGLEFHVTEFKLNTLYLVAHFTSGDHVTSLGGPL